MRKQAKPALTPSGNGPVVAREARRMLVTQLEIIAHFAASLSQEERSQYVGIVEGWLSRREDPNRMLERAKQWAEGPPVPIDLDDPSSLLPPVDAAADDALRRAGDQFSGANALFAIALKTRMAERGLSQKDLAEELGVTPSTVSQYCSGRYKPQSRTLQKLANVLGCEVSELWRLD